MSSMIDLLLGAGDKVMERPEEELEVSRLSKVLGAPFKMRVRALTGNELSNMPTGEDFAAHVVLQGVMDPDLRHEELRKKYTPEGRKTPITPAELVKILFLPGEIQNIRLAVMELSGYSDDALRKIEKN